MAEPLPHRYGGEYIDAVDNYLLVWQPLSSFGLSVLNPSATFVYKLVNGKRSYQEIVQICQREDATVSESTIGQLLDDFERKELIYWKLPKKTSPNIIEPAPSG